MTGFAPPAAMQYHGIVAPGHWISRSLPILNRISLLRLLVRVPTTHGLQVGRPKPVLQPYEPLPLKSRIVTPNILGNVREWENLPSMPLLKPFWAASTRTILFQCMTAIKLRLNLYNLIIPTFSVRNKCCAFLDTCTRAAL